MLTWLLVDGDPYCCVMNMDWPFAFLLNHHKFKNIFVVHKLSWKKSFLLNSVQHLIDQHHSNCFLFQMWETFFSKDHSVLLSPPLPSPARATILFITFFFSFESRVTIFFLSLSHVFLITSNLNFVLSLKKKIIIKISMKQNGYSEGFCGAIKMIRTVNPRPHSLSICRSDLPLTIFSLWCDGDLLHCRR